MVLTGLANYKMDNGKSYYGLFEVNLSGLSNIGALLSFLVVFRTNIAYGRFWEARGCIGGGIKICRALASQTCTYIGGNDAASASSRSNINRLIRLSFSGICHEVRADSSAEKWSEWAVANDDLTADENKMVLTGDRPPLLLLQWLRMAIHAANKAKMVEDLTARTMDENVDSLIGTYNGVTKIDSTPVPFAFNQMCKLLILSFCTIFPFALEQNIGHFSMLIAPLAAYALFGLDHISTQMMNPFGTDNTDLPLDKMVATVASDTRLAANCRIGSSAFPASLDTPKPLATPIPAPGSVL
jgi:putative membrane protein